MLNMIVGFNCQMTLNRVFWFVFFSPTKGKDPSFFASYAVSLTDYKDPIF